MKPITLRHRSASRTFAPVPHSRLVALFLARNAATLERASALSREMANPAEAIRLASATEAFFSK
jgi:hypothetical protein